MSNEVLVTADEKHALGRQYSHRVVIVIADDKLRIIKNRDGMCTDDLVGDYNHLSSLRAKCVEEIKLCGSNSRAAYRKIIKWIDAGSER